MRDKEVEEDKQGWRREEEKVARNVVVREKSESLKNRYLFPLGFVSVIAVGILLFLRVRS
jgi:hypothetical protein